MCYQKNDLIGTVLEMCGRYASAASLEEVTRRFGVVFPHNLRPRWNVAPSQNTFVIARDGRQKTVIRAAWGLRPTLSRKTILINARMETANKKPTFSDAFLHSRCIIVASGWYEWSAPQTPWRIFQLLIPVACTYVQATNSEVGKFPNNECEHAKLGLL